jgi:hypothetical protein
MPAELRVAVEAVTTALSALLTEPRSRAVRDAVGQATAAVGALDRDVTSVVLHRLVASIEDCHRDGVRHSDRLAVCRRSTSIALRLDPRWGAHATEDVAHRPAC